MPARSANVVVRRVSDTASVRLHRPSDGSEPAAALLWIHGGGLVMGNPIQDDDVCRHFADALGITVAAVKYRLAPEHPFPAAIDDCYAALVWLAGQPGIDPARIAVGGASAGGGLAAAAALRARDEGLIDLALQLLVYPMLDDRTGLRGDLDDVPIRLWSNASNRYGWSSYLGQPVGGSDVSYLAAPGRAEELSGLAPAWIGVGTADLFHDEDAEYAKRLSDAGIACQVEIVDGGFHGFDRTCSKAQVTKDFLASQTEALRAALTP